MKTNICVRASSSSGPADRVEVAKKSAQGSDGSDTQTKKGTEDVAEESFNKLMHLGTAVGSKLMSACKKAQRYDAIESEVFNNPFASQASRWSVHPGLALCVKDDKRPTLLMGTPTCKDGNECHQLLKSSLEM